jgi:hypothetical protein
MIITPKMDCQNFISEVANEFLAFPNYYEDISDLLDVTIDDYVSNNNIETNKKIVMEFAGDVYEAIQLYEFHLGNVCDLHKCTKSKFYEQLAYVSLFVKLYPQIQSIIDKNEIENFMNDANEDIGDMFHESIQCYKKRKASSNPIDLFLLD